ncbi:hypothetical protein F5Y04DRAFT_203665 [Hypomontagnella monticulosa]|nr:hypothetical protein F5Y04DRAFT_203665 [Hypomontagnella monticulosa]
MKAEEEVKLHRGTYPWYKLLNKADKEGAETKGLLADVDMPGFLDTVDVAREYHQFLRDHNTRIIHPVPEGHKDGLDKFNVPQFYDQILADPSESKTRRLRQAGIGSRKALKAKKGQSPAGSQDEQSPGVANRCNTPRPVGEAGENTEKGQPIAQPLKTQTDELPEHPAFVSPTRDLQTPCNRRQSPHHESPTAHEQLVDTDSADEELRMNALLRDLEAEFMRADSDILGGEDANGPVSSGSTGANNDLGDVQADLGGSSEEGKADADKSVRDDHDSLFGDDLADDDSLFGDGQTDFDDLFKGGSY